MTHGTYAARLEMRDWRLEQIYAAVQRLRYKHLDGMELSDDVKWCLDRIEELSKNQ